MKTLMKTAAALIALAMAVCFAPILSRADAPDAVNNEAYNETTQTNYATLADAVAAAADGDRITVLKSLNAGSQMRIYKSITIGIPEDATEDIVITSTGLGTGNYILRSEDGTSVTVKGNQNARLVFDGGSNDSRTVALMFALGNSTLDLEYVTVQNGRCTTASHSAGVRVSGTLIADNCSFIGNCAVGTPNVAGAVYLTGSGAAQISNCLFSQNVGTGETGPAVLRAAGSAPYSVSGCTIRDNTGSKMISGATNNTSGARLIENSYFDTLPEDIYSDTASDVFSFAADNHTGVIFTNPTSKNAAYTGSALAMTKVFSNWDNTRMQAVVTRDGAAATLLEPGFYEYEVSAKEGCEFYDQSFDGHFSSWVTGGSVSIGETVYKTLPAALEAAAAGDVLVLGSDNVLTGYLKINKAVTITTAGGAASGAVICCTRDTLNGNLLDIDAVGVSVKGTASSPITLDGRAKEQTSNALMYVRQSDTVIEYVDFIDITTKTNNAAAIRMNNSAGLSGIAVTGCNFMNCVVGDSENDRNGGAVLVNTNISAVFTDCVFAGCGANRGGAAFISYGSDVSFIGCVFDGNTSSGDGGAIYVNNTDGQAVTVTLTDCVFADNTAAGYGGALYLYDAAQAVIGGTDFTENTAASNGGAIYARGSVQVTVSNGSTFTANSAGDSGGALYGAGGSLYTVSDSTFADNTVVNYGRAIRSTSAFSFAGCTFTDAQAEITDCAISGNTAGAELSRTVTDCTFDQTPSLSVTRQDNTGVTCTGCTFVYIELAKPALVSANIAFDGVRGAADVVTGFDADKMSAAITYGGAPADAIQYAGEYLITVTAGRDYKFIDGADRVDSVALALTVTQSGDGSPLLSMRGTIDDVVGVELIMSPQTGDIAAANYSSIVFIGTIGGRAIEIPAVASGGSFMFSIDEIYSQFMADVISGSIVGRKEGESDSVLASLDASEGVSFSSYCGLLAQEYPDDAALLALLANTLDYGAASQTYISYNTSSLPNTAAFVAANRQTYDLPVSRATAGPVKSGFENKRIYSAGLNISNRIRLYVTVLTDDIAGTVLSVSDGAGEAEYTAASAPVLLGNNKYRFYLEKLLPQDYDKEYTIKLYSGSVSDENLVQTVEYGIYDYIARKTGTDATDMQLKAFAEAIFNYSRAAKAYVASR